MWRMTPRFATAASLATLVLAAASATKAHAAASVQSYNYSTVGSISGMPAGTGPVEFLGEAPAGAPLTTPGSVLLGTFQTNPLPAGATLSFANTPFLIDVMVTSQPGAGAVAPAYDYHVTGLLNGSYNGTGSSTAYATVTSITGNDFGLGITPPFPVSDLTVTAPQGLAAPNGPNSGFTGLLAQVIQPGFPVPAPAPEPTSIAAFAAALAGLALRRRLRRQVAGDPSAA